MVLISFFVIVRSVTVKAAILNLYWQLEPFQQGYVKIYLFTIMRYLAQGIGYL